MYVQGETMEETPLQNFLILQTLFSNDYCQNAIKRNRLVCKSWNDASRGYWMKLEPFPVLIYSTSSEEKESGGHSKGKSRSLMSLSEFFALYQAGDPVVVKMMDDQPRKMILHLWDLSQDTMQNSATLNHWFWKCTATNSLTQLTLVDCHFHQELTVFTERFLREVPNLNGLTMKNCVLSQETLSKINQAHKQWVEYPEREAWLRERTIHGDGMVWGHYRSRTRNAEYMPGGYQHSKLERLDVTLNLASSSKTDSRSSSKPPVRVWGPLLRMLPNLCYLRIGGYEKTEEPPLQLKQPGGDDDEDMQKFRPLFCSDMFTNFSNMRKTWIGGSCRFLTFPPLQRGYFWELFWEHEIGQVEWSLKVLDLLDFSASAQEYGVLSTCEAAARVRDLRGEGKVFRFSQLQMMAIDIGLDPVFAERDLVMLRLYRWTFRLTSLHLYRAPYEETFPSLEYFATSAKELHFWGNISSNLDFLEANDYSLEKLVWTTSCYEKEFHGKRSHAMLKSGRKAYPLMRYDLVERTDWNNVGRMNSLNHLEFDWGPMNSASWKKLGHAIPLLATLKGMIADDEQLALIIQLWPDLKYLEIGHGSLVTANGLEKCLPLSNLDVFKWESCACTQKHFEVHENMHYLWEIEKSLREQLNEMEMTFPWEPVQNGEHNADLKKASNSDVCILASWENALCTNNPEEFFKLYEATKNVSG